MDVHLRLASGLAQHVGHARFTLTLAEGATVADAVRLRRPSAVLSDKLLGLNHHWPPPGSEALLTMRGWELD